MKKIKRTTRSAEEIPLSSTADIAFLLIVFFLAASALLELRGVTLPLPKKDAPPMQILKKNIYKIYIDKEGNYSHENQTYSLEELKADVEKAYAENDELVVVVRPQKETPAQSIPKVIQILRELNINRVSLGLGK